MLYSFVIKSVKPACFAASNIATNFITNTNIDKLNGVIQEVRQVTVIIISEFARINVSCVRNIHEEIYSHVWWFGSITYTLSRNVNDEAI